MANKAQTASLERPAGTREAILDSAEELFAERGFAGTSVRDIVRASETSPPSLYHFFGSKENLLVELVTDRYTRYCDALERELALAGTAVEVFQRCFDLALANIDEQPKTAKFLFSILFGPQQDVPKGPLQQSLVRWELIVHKRLSEVAPEVSEERRAFARLMLNGLMTPPVLLFLTTGTKEFPTDLSHCLALRAAAVLGDPYPVCAWPNFTVDQDNAD